MPGKRITGHQVHKYKQHRNSGNAALIGTVEDGVTHGSGPLQSLVAPFSLVAERLCVAATRLGDGLAHQGAAKENG